MKDKYKQVYIGGIIIGLFSGLVLGSISLAIFGAIFMLGMTLLAQFMMGL